jgi:hypothetical protein
MVKEAAVYGGVLLVDPVTVKGKKPVYLLSSASELQVKCGLFEFGLRKGSISRATFESDKKPIGWNEVRSKRLFYKEQIERILGTNEEQLHKTATFRKKQVRTNIHK